MADKQPIQETIIPAIQSISQATDESLVHTILTLIRTTVFPKNHNAIVEALNNMLEILDNDKWLYDFADTISSLLEQKKAVENKGVLAATMTRAQIKHFLRDFSDMNPWSLDSTKITITSISPYSKLYDVTLQLSEECRLAGFSVNNEAEWAMGFKPISQPRIPAKKSNIILLPGKLSIFFEEGRWWHNFDSVESECLRSEVFRLASLRCLKNALTEEAWADIIKEDQSILLK